MWTRPPTLCSLYEYFLYRLSSLAFHMNVATLFPNLSFQPGTFQPSHGLSWAQVFVQLSEPWKIFPPPLVVPFSIFSMLPHTETPLVERSPSSVGYPSLIASCTPFLAFGKIQAFLSEVFYPFPRACTHLSGASARLQVDPQFILIWFCFFPPLYPDFS